METPISNPPMTRMLVKKGALATDPFTLVDVGASGHIESYWRSFEPEFRAIGFDPLVREMQRLSNQEHSKNVRYEAYWLGCDDYESLLGAPKNTIPNVTSELFERTSARRAMNVQKRDYIKEEFNANQEVIYTERRTTLDRFLETDSIASVDFIKIDTDGSDYEVVLGALKALQGHRVLGLMIECQFQSVPHPHVNVFANIDRVLREQGLLLFDMEYHRYSRACLPSKFVYRIPAQTVSGQVMFADVVYLRDLGSPNYEQRWNINFSREKILKLASLFEIFRMPDCAAELILKFEDSLGAVISVGECLDLLAQQAKPSFTSFRELNKQFDQSIEKWYP
jgi:FkbM family methyltransferase